MKAHLLAAVVAVTPSAKMHLNGSLWLFYSLPDEMIHHVCIDFQGHGGYGHTGFQLPYFFDIQAMFLAYWEAKAALMKGAEWVNLKQVREQVLADAVMELRRLGDFEVDSSHCLVRFDAVRMVDPFYLGIHHLKPRNERFFDWLIDHRKFDLHYGRFEMAQWIEKVRPILLEMPVLPFVYRCGDYRDVDSRRRHRVDVRRRCHGVMAVMQRCLGDKMASAKWVQIIKRLGWADLETVKKIAHAKSVRRAQRRGLVSTAAARGWFQKFHAVGLLGSWARREEEARKQSTNKEAIS